MKSYQITPDFKVYQCLNVKKICQPDLKFTILHTNYRQRNPK